jgi:hypothetical protein
MAQWKPSTYTVIWWSEEGARNSLEVEAMNAEEAIIRTRNIVGFECRAKVEEIKHQCQA